MVTYKHCEKGQLNLISEAYLETHKHLRRIFMREQLTAKAVN